MSVVLIMLLFYPALVLAIARTTNDKNDPRRN